MATLAAERGWICFAEADIAASLGTAIPKAGKAPAQTTPSTWVLAFFSLSLGFFF